MLLWGLVRKLLNQFTQSIVKFTGLQVFCVSSQITFYQFETCLGKKEERYIKVLEKYQGVAPGFIELISQKWQILWNGNMTPSYFKRGKTKKWKMIVIRLFKMLKKSGKWQHYTWLEDRSVFGLVWATEWTKLDGTKTVTSPMSRWSKNI